MLQELTEQDKEKTKATEDLAWRALTDCQITMSLDGLLQLVPQFMETITTILRKEQLSQAPINFTNPSEGPTVMDDHSN